MPLIKKITEPPPILGPSLTAKVIKKAVTPKKEEPSPEPEKKVEKKIPPTPLPAVKTFLEKLPPSAKKEPKGLPIKEEIQQVYETTPPIIKRQLSLPEKPVEEKTVPKKELTPIEYLELQKEYRDPFYGTHLQKYGKTLLTIPVGQRMGELVFRRKVFQTFKELPPEKKFEYGLLYGGIKEEPVSKWRYYKGGVEYLKSLPQEERERLLKEYMESNEWKAFVSSPRGKEQIEATRESMAREGLGPLDIVTVVGVDVAKAEEQPKEERTKGIIPNISSALERIFGKPQHHQVKLSTESLNRRLRFEKKRKEEKKWENEIKNG